MEIMKVTVSDFLNLRDKPSNDGKVIGRLMPGQLVEAGENKNGWRAIDGGWAYGGSGYLTHVEGVTITLPADTARQLAEALKAAGLQVG